MAKQKTVEKKTKHQQRPEDSGEPSDSLRRVSSRATQASLSSCLPFFFLIKLMFSKSLSTTSHLPMISLLPPSLPPPRRSSLAPSLLLLRRRALEEINRRWSRYKSSAPRFPIHSPPHSSPPLSLIIYAAHQPSFFFY